MGYEHSCGAVVYAKCGRTTRYVIIRQRDGGYGFPKGHMEAGETEEETALREIKEEVGLSVSIRRGFVACDEYVLPKRQNTKKRVTYFLAECAHPHIRIQKKELISASLLTYEEALKTLTFESSKRILTKARDFLEQ